MRLRSTLIRFWRHYKYNIYKKYNNNEAPINPEPVCAHASTSKPSRAKGTACFWIGVGVRYLQGRADVKWGCRAGV